MAHDPAPLTELLKINDQNVADVDGITDLLQNAPVLAALVADFASNGTQHKYLKEVLAPVVGFRVINDGRDHDHSEDELVTVELGLLDCSFHVDQAYADEYKYGRDAWLAREGARHIRAGFALAEKQIIYGTGNDAAGFAGLADSPTLDGLTDPMVVNAGGLTALSSVYLIRSTTALEDAVVITGNEGNISLGETYQQMMPGSVTGHFNAYVTPVYAHLGLQIGSVHSVGRICNLDASANGLTDDLIAEAISRFPAGKEPTHLAMSRRSRSQLQQSRTATNPTGAPAPFPESAFNIPIIATEQISDTETAVA